MSPRAPSVRRSASRRASRRVRLSPAAGSKATIFAAGARLGLAAGVRREVPLLDDNGDPVLGPDGELMIQVVTDLPERAVLCRRRHVGPRLRARSSRHPLETIDINGVPDRAATRCRLLNAELRVPVIGGLGVVGFMDTAASSTGSATSTSARSGRRRAGLRYQSPIGPIASTSASSSIAEHCRRRAGSADQLHISLGQAF